MHVAAHPKNQGGFTLVELLVVIGIISTLAAMLRSVDTPGTFEVKTCEKESAEGRGQGLIICIRFVPKTLVKNITFVFSIC